jgi:aspartyl-tRNA(Asn)/glutamyl-tRNA(Gln) amidotransferase subunit A
VEPLSLTASELAPAVREGSTSASDALESVLSAIGDREDEVHAYISLMTDGAREHAAEIDRRAAAGEPLGPLAGVPIAIKDNICIKGHPATCGSKILEPFVSPYDATVIEKLRAADAVFIGKANMDEFAMGSSTETSYFGVTRNPHDTDRVPGGSSGGSAAAVAAGEAVISLGSDTGGSIRQPASLCGVVGMKPTYGRVSRYGLVAFASSLDQIGPFSRTVRDSALLLNVISGHDPHDSTSSPTGVPDYTENLERGVSGMKIGVPAEYFGEGLNPETRDAVQAVITSLESEGAELIDISLPHMQHAIATYYLIATSEASSNLARYDGVKFGFRAENAQGLMDMYRKTRSEGFGAEVKRRILLGTYALSSGYYDAYYLKAQKVRTLIVRDFSSAFEKVDAIITPTTPSPAFRVGEKSSDPLEMYLEDIYTVSCNLAGIPGISVPAGMTSGGLPIGLQVLGPQFGEETILQIARAAEVVRDRT